MIRNIFKFCEQGFAHDAIALWVLVKCDRCFTRSSPLYADGCVAGSADDVLPTIERLGYNPEIRHVDYASGVHVLAILKDEHHEQAVDDDYWLEEWLQVRSQINADAVHLWRGK